MNNSGQVPDDLLKAATRLFFSQWGGCDFQVKDDGILIGIEPTYQYERLRLVFIAKNKGDSYFRTGVAWGSYGSQIVSQTMRFSEYKRQSKFTRFVEKWHEQLFNNSSAALNLEEKEG